MKNFFISYNKADLAWAEWIAWQLEEAGYTTVLQVWDFRPGSNFVLEMQRGTAQAERTIAVLSPDYLEARFAQPEWAAALFTGCDLFCAAKDHDGQVVRRASAKAGSSNGRLRISRARRCSSRACQRR